MAGKTAIDFEESVNEELKAKERTAFGMRTLRGLPLSEAAPWEDDLRDLQEKGLVSLNDGRWLLTPRGRLLADSVAEIFI